MACAAALAAIDVIDSEGLCARADVIGQRIRDRFTALASRTDVIADVRGLGAMVGIEFCHEGDPHRPATEVVAAALWGLCGAFAAASFANRG